MEDVIKSILLISHFHVQRASGNGDIVESYEWTKQEYDMFTDELENKAWDTSAVFFHDKGIRWKWVEE